MSDVTTTLLTSWGEPPKEDLGNGMIAVRLSSGEPHTHAIYNAVLNRYHAVAGRRRPSDDDLQALLRQKVTIIMHGENMLGGGMLVAREGTLFTGSSGDIAILPKRARRNGYRIDLSKTLDVIPGYSLVAAQTLVAKARSHFPTLRPLTQERLEELPEPDGYGGDRTTLSLCLFGTYRMPDDSAYDTLLLAGAYDRENDIVDDSVLLIRPEVGVSEHGSQYGQHVLHVHKFGEVVGYEPISFAEGLALCNLDFDEAYDRVVGSVREAVT